MKTFALAYFLHGGLDCASCAGSLEQSMGARGGIYRVVVPARQATYAGGIDSFELIPGLLKSLKMPSLFI